MYLVLAFSLYWQDGSEVRKPLESIQRESPAPKLFCCLEINFCRPSLIDWCNHCDDNHSFFNPWLWHVCRFHPTSQPAAQAVLPDLPLTNLFFLQLFCGEGEQEVWCLCVPVSPLSRACLPHLEMFRRHPEHPRVSVRQTWLRNVPDTRSPHPIWYPLYCLFDFKRNPTPQKQQNESHAALKNTLNQ